MSEIFSGRVIGPYSRSFRRDPQKAVRIREEIPDPSHISPAYRQFETAGIHRGYGIVTESHIKTAAAYNNGCSFPGTCHRQV